jgi:hypothetical protein
MDEAGLNFVRRRRPMAKLTLYIFVAVVVVAVIAAIAIPGLTMT